MKRVSSTLAVLIAATLMSSTPVWAKDKDVQLPDRVKKTYEEVLEQVPELKKYENADVNDQGGRYTINLAKSNRGDHPSAFIEIDKKTGDIVSFKHTSYLEHSTNPPSDDLAKDKATDFLQEILDDQFESYKLDGVKEVEIFISNEDEEGNEADVERNAKRVLFTTNNDEAVNFAVVVDTDGVIYSVEPVLTEAKLDKKVQESVEQLYEVVPELEGLSYEIERKDYKGSEKHERPENSLFRDEVTFRSEGAIFRIDNITGDLNHLDLHDKEVKSNNPISKEVAKVKAGQFVQQVFEDSEKYKFVGLGTPYSEKNDTGTIVGFTTPLKGHSGYLKFLKVVVAQNGEIYAVNVEAVEEDDYNFEEHFKNIEKPWNEENK
ncbi:YcdB/YcdC domain-containing protein [Brevibacillus sp. 179-C9.3 HS]|uniref:YcdB/YcdC domain-containing protein n=1 Tax=unclassified Brevibacillus TaxID=2684853 RepID=UPI00399FDB48